MRGLRRLVVVAAMAWALVAPAAERKLNVLLILSDDLCADLGTYGKPVITPNVDALAKQGVRLDRVYCQYPLCGPSRCSFMSGLNPDTTGVLVNNLPVRHKIKDVVTLPELFRKNGYYAARSGKVYHLGIPGGVGKPGNDDPQSWDYAFDPKSGEYPTAEDGEEYVPEPKLPQGFRRNLLKDDEGKSQADYQIATEAIRLLGEHKDKPFFLTVGFIRPHVPEIAPKKFFEMYDPKKITLPDVSADDRDDVPAPAFMYPKNMGMSDADCVESKRAYYATTSFMDHQMGRVIAEVDRLGLRDSTVIVFMSDHGYLLGQHFAWQKMMLFEDVCRVPMIFSYPGMAKRGVGARGIAESIDLYPTVADLCGLEGPKELQGKSMRAMLEDPAKPFKNAAFTMMNRRQLPGRSVRTDRYRYTEWDGGASGAELYDYEADPAEVTNLAKDPKHAATVAELKGLLKQRYPDLKAGLPERKGAGAGDKE